MTLNQITALFDALNDDEQLLLLDCLADRTDVADEINLGLQNAAYVHYCSYLNTAEEAEAYAESVIPRGSISQERWERHAKARDALLEGAINTRVANGWIATDGALAA